MGKISTVILKGKSGKKYIFDVYELDTAFKALAAVYCITKRYQKKDRSFTHDVIYVGETADLSSRFDSHHKAQCFSHHQANCICIYLEDDEQARKRIEADLIAYYNPPCNG